MTPNNQGRIGKVIEFTFLGISYLALLGALIFGVWNIGHRFNPDFRSPFDEHTHFDYWWKIYHEHRLPEVYEKIDKASLHIWGCKDRENPLRKNACVVSEQGPSVHENTASNYPPTFYIASAGMAALINWFHPTQDLFHLAKYSTLAWGILCLFALAVTSATLGIPPLINAILVFAIAQTPAFVFAAITFNQEIFVLLCSLVGLILYTRLQTLNKTAIFAIAGGLFSAFCLSVKPTAMLIPVMIVMAEGLATHRPFKMRLRRVVSFSAVSLGAYVLFTNAVNAFRGINPSDGKMQEYLIRLGEGTDRSWTTQAEMVWVHFTRSTGSLNWRALVDWGLPWLFPYFHQFLLAMLVAATVVVLVMWRLRTEPLLSARLLVGCMAAFVALPLTLALYLSTGDFPFFFQPRYFTAYIIVGVIAGAALLTDLLRLSVAGLKERFITYGKSHEA